MKALVLLQIYINGFLRDLRGVSALEYAILTGAVVTAAGAGLIAFGDQIAAALTDVTTSMGNTVGNAEITP